MDHDHDHDHDHEEVVRGLASRQGPSDETDGPPYLLVREKPPSLPVRRRQIRRTADLPTLLSLPLFSFFSAFSIPLPRLHDNETDSDRQIQTGSACVRVREREKEGSVSVSLSHEDLCQNPERKPLRHRCFEH